MHNQTTQNETLQATTAPPLPETYGRTIGPGHLDMVREMMEEARELASAVANGDNQTDQARAAKSIDELLEAADKHASAYEVETVQQFHRLQDNSSSEARRALVSLEEPIYHARGQAHALAGALESANNTDPLCFAGAALTRTMDALLESWDHAVHKG